MRKCLLIVGFIVALTNQLFAQTPPTGHPNTNGAGWKPLFERDLSDATYAKGVWSYDEGELTATADKAIWTATPYDDFILDLFFKTAKGTNSGIVVHCSDTTNWIPNSVEIQLADDHDKHWSEAPTNVQSGAFFGHQAPTKKLVKEPGEWNRCTVTCQGKMIYVVLNNQLVNTIDLTKFTAAQKNPDGSDVPAWFTKPAADLPLHGYIGLQGKHAGAPIYFRNLKIKTL